MDLSHISLRGVGATLRAGGQYSSIPIFPPGRRTYPPACKPYGLEAGPEAKWGEAPNLSFYELDIQASLCGHYSR
jgi:hypothetical protein